MITRRPLTRQYCDWQSELANAINDPRELLALLQLDPDLLPDALKAAEDFKLRTPRGYVARMRIGDINDPLLRQVLPLGEECLNIPGYSADPVGDLAAMARPGLLHKYHGRALLVATGACAIHCRYCFRRHYPYNEARPGAQQWRELIDYLHEDTHIEEIILSGGDPLTLSDARLHALIEALEGVPHLRRLRLHTRLPVVLPERITTDLLRSLRNTRLQSVCVIHANHANEIDADVVQALQALKQADVTLLNQSVLLRGVNDSVDALADLSQSLFCAGVLPYYLHMLDRVAGAAHFEVPIERAETLMHSLSARLSGYLVPRLVREVPGESGKTPIVFSRETNSG